MESKEIEIIQEKQVATKEISINLPLVQEWKAFGREVTEIFSRPLLDEEIFIRPDGLLYTPQTIYRQRLNEAYGSGNWTLYKEKVFEERVKDSDGKDKFWVYYVGVLYAYGQYIGQAGGQHAYYGTNNKTSKMDAVESAKSDCITRICKDLGIAGDLWNPEFIYRWKKKNAIFINVKNSWGKPSSIWVKKLSDGEILVPEGFTILDNPQSGQPNQSQPTQKSEPKEEVELTEEQNKEFWKAIKSGSVREELQEFGVRWGFIPEYNKDTKKYYIKTRIELEAQK